MNLTDIGTIKSLLNKHELWAKKAFGQNFLTSEKALSKIIETANLQPEDHIIEIGPGLGVLTQELVQSAAKVSSIELDKTLFPVLEETVGMHQNLEIIHQDALQFQPPKTPYKVVANIPYNITSPIINHFLQAENKPLSMTLLVQKEVAEKACQLDPKMSVLSLQIALFAQATYCGKVPSGAFHPAPKVDSAILHLQTYTAKDPRKISDNQAQEILNLAKRAFSSGRKKLSNTLPDLKEKLEKLQLSDARPQHLSIKDWQQL